MFGFYCWDGGMIGVNSELSESVMVQRNKVIDCSIQYVPHPFGAFVLNGMQRRIVVAEIAFALHFDGSWQFCFSHRLIKRYSAFAHFYHLLLHGLIEVLEQLQIIVVHHEHFVQDSFPNAQKVLDGYSSCFHAP